MSSPRRVTGSFQHGETVNDERVPFLNGSRDGNLICPSDGAYACRVSAEHRAISHLCIHTLLIDTEGAPQGNIKTFADRKYMESIKTGWFSGSPHRRFRDYRMNFCRAHTQSSGNDVCGGIGFVHELHSCRTSYESVLETFYRIRLTNAIRSYMTVLPE